jgi:hypothetical protein
VHLQQNPVVEGTQRGEETLGDSGVIQNLLKQGEFTLNCGIFSFLFSARGDVFVRVVGQNFARSCEVVLEMELPPTQLEAIVPSSLFWLATLGLAPEVPDQLRPILPQGGRNKSWPSLRYFSSAPHSGRPRFDLDV